MKQAYHAADPVDAQLAVDRLAAEGIHAHTQGRFLSGATGELPAGELLRVWVEDADLERAKQVLATRARGDDALAAGELDPLFVRSWQRAWSGLGASGDGLAARDALLAAWGEPQRRYHTLRHLRDCLALLEPHLALAEHPAEVEIALWFHDAVYDTKAEDNEARSAQRADEALAGAGVPLATVQRVHALVMVTRHDAMPDSADERLLVDVDLAILGAEPAAYERYRTAVRAEYAHVTGDQWRAGRAAVLRSLLAKEPLYRTPTARDRWTTQAHRNLRAELATLD